MSRSSEKGIAHILLMVVLLAGLVFGVYLIQQKTNLFSKAGFISSPVGYPTIDFITVNGSSKNSQLDFTWTWPADQIRFAIRLDKDPHSYNPTNLDDEEILNDYHSSNTLVTSCTPGHTYRLWVHSVDGSGKLSTEVGEQTVVCQGNSNSSCPSGFCPPSITRSQTENSRFSVSWINPAYSVEYFALRVDKDPYSYDPFNPNSSDIIINDFRSKDYSQSCVSGATYRLWVHGVNSEGRYTDIDEVTLICSGGNDKPVPTQSPDSCPSTSRSYGQCGGTTGLEGYPATHTIEVTETTDCNGQKSYSNKDLFDRGECPQ